MFRFGDQKSKPPHDARVSLAYILHVLDASLNANLGRHGVNRWRVESRCQADRLGILGLRPR